MRCPPKQACVGKYGGLTLVLEYISHRAEAVSGAKEIVKRQTPSQVIVHKSDGKVQTEYTYGGDPRRSKG
jgi:hypothetical protein